MLRLLIKAVEAMEQTLTLIVSWNWFIKSKEKFLITNHGIRNYTYFRKKILNKFSEDPFFKSVVIVAKFNIMD